MARTRTLKLACDCGFFMGSHDENEIIELSLLHLRKKQGQTGDPDAVRKKLKVV